MAAICAARPGWDCVREAGLRGGSGHSAFSQPILIYRNVCDAASATIIQKCTLKEREPILGSADQNCIADNGGCYDDNPA